MTFIPSVGGRSRDQGLLRASSTTTSKLLADALAAKKARPVSVFEVLLPAFVAGPDPDGHARLPRRARRRARRHLRGPLARADRGARHDGRLSSRATTCTRRWGTSSRSASRCSARPSSRSRACTAATRIPQEAIIGIAYAVAAAASILVMSKATRRDRAPEGDARRQHPLGLVAGARQDGRLLYALVGAFHFVLRKTVPPDLDGRARGRAAGPQRPLLGLPVLRARSGSS